MAPRPGDPARGGAGDRDRAGRRLPAVRLSPRRRARAAGFVLNDSAGVLIDVEGQPEQIAELTRRLVDDVRRRWPGWRP